jgi:hypothetical protein
MTDPRSAVDQPFGLHFDFRGVLGLFSGFTHGVFLELIFNHQLRARDNARRKKTHLHVPVFLNCRHY